MKSFRTTLKKYLIFILLFFSILLNNIHVDSELQEGTAGSYSPLTGKIICYQKWTCLHEIGHKIDYEENNRFSASKEWADVVDYYNKEIFEPTGNPDNIEDRIFNFPGINGNDCYKYNDGNSCWGGYAEVYAAILEHSRGIPENMPEIFRKYYNWERIWELQKQYSQKE